MTLRIRKPVSNLANSIALTGSLAVALFGPTNASALDLVPDLPSLGGSYYGGVGFSSSSIEPRVNESGFTVTDSTDGGVQLFLGRDLKPRISIEGYYSEMGDAHLSSDTRPGGRINYSTMGASGLFYLLGGGGKESIRNRQGLSIYARLGFGKLNNQERGIPEFNRINEWHWSSGLGAEYNLRNGFGMRAEFHNFDTDARVVSLNLIKRFRMDKGNPLPVITERADRLEIAGADTDEDKPLKLAARDNDGDGVTDDIDLCNETEEGVSVDSSGCAFTGVLQGVTFTSGSTDLTKEGSDTLDKVIAELKKNTLVKVSVQAHTDNQGSAQINMDLSRKRAETVVRYLVDIGGIDLSRMSAIGFGESRPRQSNRTAAGRSANRRVEIKVVN